MITTRDELRELRARVLGAAEITGDGKSLSFGLTHAQLEMLAEATMKAEEAAGLAVVSTKIGALTEMAIATLKEHNAMVERGDADKGKPDWTSSICEAIDTGNLLTKGD